MALSRKLERKGHKAQRRKATKLHQRWVDKSLASGPVEADGGHRFAFSCLAARAAPQRAALALPKETREKWDLDGPAERPENWEVNQ